MNAEELWPKDGAMVGAEHCSVGCEVRKRGIWRTIERVQRDKIGDRVWLVCNDGSVWLTARGALVRIRPVRQ